MITEMTIAERNTGTATLMRALEACHKSGEVITVQSPFEDGPTRLVDVPVIDIDVAAQKFQVKRVGDDIGKWFAIRHIQSITLLSGETLASADGEAYWKEIQSRRGRKAEWHNELAKPHHIPDVSKAPYGVRAQLIGDGTRIPGPPGSKREVELWIVRSNHSGLTGIDVKDSIAARRVCGLVEASYWNIVQAWLACEFEWPDWIRTNTQGGLVPAGTVTKVFRWGQETPADLVSLFMAKSWERHRIFKPSDNQLTVADAKRLGRIGLCVEAENMPLNLIFEHALSRDIRSILKARGLKSMDRDHGLAQLQEIAVTDADAVHAALRATPGFGGKWCLLAPCSLTWSEWQDFRKWHSAMVYAFCEFF